MEDDPNLHMWEPVDDPRAPDLEYSYGISTHRMKVPGGWIYRMRGNPKNGATESSVFVPDVPRT